MILVLRQHAGATSRWQHRWISLQSHEASEERGEDVEGGLDSTEDTSLGYAEAERRLVHCELRPQDHYRREI